MAFASLTIDLNARIANIEKDLGRMANLAEIKAKGMEQAFGRVAGVLGALGGLGAGAGLIGLVRNLVDGADEMRDLAIAAGTSVSSLASYELVAKQSGTSTEALAKGLGKITLFMANYAAEARRLGITASDPVRALEQLAAALSQAQTPAERNAIANKVLGKSYAELMPLLDMGQEALRASADAARPYAERMEKLAEQSDRFNDLMAQLGQSAKVVGLSIADTLLPSILDVAQGMADATEKGNGLLAVMRLFGGLGKLPFDLVLGSSDVDGSVDATLKDLQQKLSDLRRHRADAEGQGLLHRVLYGTKQDLDREILVTTNQIEAIRQAKDKLRLPKIEPPKPEGLDTTLHDDIKRAFDTSPIDNFVKNLSANRRKISAEYAALKAELSAPAAGETVRGIDVSHVVAKGREQLARGDASGAQASLAQGKDLLREAARQGESGFVTGFLADQLRDFELQFNDAAEQAARDAKATVQAVFAAKEGEAIKLGLDVDDVRRQVREMLDGIQAELAANPLRFAVARPNVSATGSVSVPVTPTAAVADALAGASRARGARR